MARRAKQDINIRVFILLLHVYKKQELNLLYTSVNKYILIWKVQINQTYDDHKMPLNTVEVKPGDLSR